METKGKKKLARYKEYSTISLFAIRTYTCVSRSLNL